MAALMRVLVVNAGSSSLKLSVVDERDITLAQQHLPHWEGDARVLEAFAEQHRIDAVGHRIVHGGTVFDQPTEIGDRVRAQISDLTPLAPLHQPRALAALDVVRETRPDLPSVACFDTAFHAHLPPSAATYAVPARWRTRWNVRRFGFHGLSHAYAARRTAQLLARPVESLRTVTCHLGAGASLCAVNGGRSVDTTMGFTPLEGLVMATRSGSVDPGLLVWLLEHAHLTSADLNVALEQESGLLALSEQTPDLAEILRLAEAGDPRAGLAVDVYLHRLVGAIAAMTAAMGGLDALTFTGGVGENASSIRSAAAGRLGFLGVEIDTDANSDPALDAVVSPSGSQVGVLVVAAREDVEIASQVRGLLAGSPEHL